MRAGWWRLVVRQVALNSPDRAPRKAAEMVAFYGEALALEEATLREQSARYYSNFSAADAWREVAAAIGFSRQHWNGTQSVRKSACRRSCLR